MMSVMIMGSSHVVKLKAMIDRVFSGKIWNIEDVHWLGKSGLTAERLADNNDSLSITWREELMRIQPDVIVLILGSNDLDTPVLGKGSMGEVDQVLHWMGKVVEWIRPLTRQLVLMPLLPRIFPRTTACNFRKKYPGRPDYMHLRWLLNMRLRELPISRFGISIENVEKFMSDDVHFTDQGYRILLKRIIRTLRSI